MYPEDVPFLGRSRSGSRRQRGVGWFEYAKRMVGFSQMDFQYAQAQMVALCRTPSTVVRMTQYRKQIKNRWARDDPAFVVILLGLIVASNAAYAVTFGVTSVWHFLTVLFNAIAMHFLFTGASVATIGCWAANRFMISARSSHHVEQAMEWLYAFDVHCNAYFPAFLLTNVIQFFLTPVLLEKTFLATVLSNLLWGGAVTYYCYITFLGYRALPFLQYANRILSPVSFVVILVPVFILTGVNPSRAVLSYYYG